MLVRRVASRAAATSKMEYFVMIVNSWKPLTIITKRCILDVAAALDPPLVNADSRSGTYLEQCQLLRRGFSENS